MRRFAFRPLSDRRRAMTLVELMVSMAVGLAVMAVLLVTFDHTQRSASREVARNALHQEATLALHRVATDFSQAIPPSALDLPEPVITSFTSDEAILLTWSSADAESLPLKRIAGEEDLAIALEYRTGQTADWHSALTEDEFPTLVRVTVTATNTERDDLDPVTLSTVVATGVGGAS